MANYTYSPSESFQTPDGSIAYSHPLEANKWNPSKNFYRIINFEPEAIPDKLNNGYTFQDWQNWKARNPHMAGTYVFDNYTSWTTQQTQGAQLNAEGYKISPLNDIYRSGQIRGTNFFNGQAYMAAGFPDEQYRSTITPATGEKNSFKYSTNFGGGLYTKEPVASTKNLYIEMTPDFVAKAAAGQNPLYNGVSSKSFIPPPSGSAEANGARQGVVTPEIITKWSQGFKAEQGGGRLGGYAMLNPKNGTPFLERINPFNRTGVRMVQTDPVPLLELMDTYRLRPSSPAEYLDFQKQMDFFKQRTASGIWTHEYANGAIPRALKPLPTSNYPFNAEVLYDGITPYGERTLGQHARNALFNLKTMYAQPETQTILRGAGTAAKVGIGLAGAVGYASSVAKNGPVETALSWGVPFTPLKFGIGPVLTLNADDEERLREMQQKSTSRND